MTNTSLIKKVIEKAKKENNNDMLLKIGIVKKSGKFIPHSTKLELQSYIKC